MLTNEEKELGYKEGIIYLFVCLCNLKVYVGQTIDEVGRYSSHKNAGGKDSIAFHNAINYYGFENFSYNVLYREKVNYSIKEEAEKLHNKLNELEIYYIKYYNSTNKFLGYNITEGGKGTRGALKNPESLEKYRTTRKRKREENPSYCTPRARAVLKLNLLGEILGKYISVSQAASENGVSTQLIISRCGLSDKLARKSHVDKDGNVWIYEDEYEFLKHIFPLVNIHEHNPEQSKEVVQFDIEGNKLREFNFIGEAVLFLFPEIKGDRGKIATATSKISYACNGNLRNGKVVQTAYGYRWKYKKDYVDGDILPPLEVIPNKVPSFYKPILKLDSRNNILKEYKSISDAARELFPDKKSLGGVITKIRNACETSKEVYNYKWKYKNNNDK